MNQTQNQNNAADGQSRAGEAGANLTDVLAAELTIEKICKEMADEFQANGKDWPREWMIKHTEDRKILIEARRILIERAEAANIKLSERE